MTKTVRQGDLLFIRRDKAPKEYVVLADDVIARGTATGHTHVLRHSSRSKLVRFENVLFVIARSTARIDHQEHITVILTPGTWEIRQQREETPEGFRQVED